MKRKPFEGVWNVVRFNWHFYVIIFAIIGLILFMVPRIDESYQVLLLALVCLMILPILISLLVTYKIYDASSLYTLDWLEEYGDKLSIANFSAGFDETTALIKEKKPKSQIIPLDFYDPEKHTEVSIKRARKAYPAVPGTLKVKTSNIPLEENSMDLAIGFLSMHEIRDEKERIIFFQNLIKVLKSDGEIVVIEHLRDGPNFLAYNIGFLHFHSNPTWLHTFKNAGLTIKEEIKMNPFMTKFKLSYGTTT